MKRLHLLSLIAAASIVLAAVYLTQRAVNRHDKSAGDDIIEASIEAAEEECCEEESEWVVWETAEELLPNADSPFDAVQSNSLLGVGGGAVGLARPRSETYAPIEAVAGFQDTLANPAVTFAADVDTGAYSNVRRMILRDGTLPPTNAVRVEEFVNYFPYAGLGPAAGAPIGASIEVSSCPWAPGHRLAQVVLRTSPIPAGNRQPANLVFLVDVSGSMAQPDKLPLLKEALGLLIGELKGRDRVAIAVYAGAAGLALPSTACSNKDAIRSSLLALEAGGSTAGAAGIQLAYQVAARHFIPGGINRVILATDGDFNVGISDREELKRFIERKAKSGVFLTTLGFGAGNLNDALLEQLADHGNGAYAYIDSELEAKKVLVAELGATLEVAAKDVKLQLQVNPARYSAHRLLGYANRRLAHRDFDDDSKDGGEMGAGHVVTALIELVPRGSAMPASLEVRASGDGLTERRKAAALELRVRYKTPEGHESRLLTFSGEDGGGVIAAAPVDLRFAAAVAWFGESLAGDSERAPWDDVRALAQQGAAGDDEGGYRKGFLELLDRATELAQRQ